MCYVACPSGQRRHSISFWRYYLVTIDVLTLFLIIRSDSVSAVVRCYCNDAQCVNTGYICKSEVGLCYTALTSSAHHEAAVADSRWSSAPRGCVDFLSAPPGGALPRSCQSDVGAGLTSSTSSRQPTESGYQLGFVCCQRDLCNYPDGSRASGRIESVGDEYSDQFNVDDSDEKLLVAASWSTISPPTPQTGVLDATGSLFRAAVIIVPIAGLILLALLVLVASRMLLYDVRRRPITVATNLYSNSLSSVGIRNLACHSRDPTSRNACRCGDRASGVICDGAGSRYEKIASCESMVSSLVRDAMAAELALHDRVTSYGVLLDGVVGADDVICTFADDARVSLV